MTGKTKNKEEEEEPARSQDDRRPGPAHFLEAADTAHTGREQQEEERKQMNTTNSQLICVVFSCRSNSALVVPVRHALYAMLSLLKYNKSQSYSSTPTVRLFGNLTQEKLPRDSRTPQTLP